MAIAAYIYKPDDKAYDFDQLLSYLREEAQDDKTELSEIYADGWVEIPNGLEDLIADVKHYDMVILYSLEGMTHGQFESLLKGTQIYCVLTPWIGIAKSIETQAAKRMGATIEAKQYYKSLRSLSIRAGIKASDKKSGAAPYGYRYDDSGTLQPNDDNATLNLVRSLKSSGYSVVEIAKRTGLNEKKIYGILHYWKEK